MAPPTHTRTCTGPHAAWRGARRGAACGTRPTRPAGAARSPQESTSRRKGLHARCTGAKKVRKAKKRREQTNALRTFQHRSAHHHALHSILYFQRTHNTPDHTTVEHTSVNTPSLSVWSPPGPATCMLALRAGPQRARRRRTDKTTTVGREGIRVW